MHNQKPDHSREDLVGGSQKNMKEDAQMDTQDSTKDASMDAAGEGLQDDGLPMPPRESSSEGDPTATLQGEIDKLKDQLLRAVAEQENIRKRAERDRQDASKYAVAEFAKAMINVADNFERALESCRAMPNQGDPVIKAVVDGISITEAELVKALERFGIRKHVPAVGDRFDPNHHQAMFELDHDLPLGHIAQVMQIGYTHHERLLRPAMVGVSKGPSRG